MGLREKIFLAFFIIVTLLLGVTLYYTNTQTTKFELARIIGKLQNTQGRFLDKFETEREAALKLVGTITSDQKYRSFLQQARDNYYPFAEEIGLDTKADLVFVVGEDMAVLGTYPLSKSGDGKQVRGKQIAWVMERVEEDHVNGLLGEILDNGKSISRVLSFGGLLMNTINVPLKESLSDDYALGVVSVSFAINDDWVKQLLKDESPEKSGIFHLDGKPVAANIPMARSGALLDAAMAVPGGKGFEFEGERFIMLHDAFAKAGRPAGYLFAVSLDKDMAPFVALQWKIFALGVLALITGLGVMLGLANRIVRPIRQLVTGTQEVLGGNYDYKVEPQSRDEVGQLTRAFNDMTEGLQEKKQIHDMFVESERALGKARIRSTLFLKMFRWLC